MLHDMNVNAGTQRFMKAFFASAFHYLFYGEVVSLGVFPMKKSHSDPDFVSDFQLRLSGQGLKTSILKMRYIHYYKVFLDFQEGLAARWFQSSHLI
jgi:hypothetical protein